MPCARPIPMGTWKRGRQKVSGIVKPGIFRHSVAIRKNQWRRIPMGGWSAGHSRTLPKNGGNHRDLQGSTDLGTNSRPEGPHCAGHILALIGLSLGKLHSICRWFPNWSNKCNINVPFPGEDSWWVGAAKKNDSTVLPFCDLAMTELQAEDVEMSHTERHRCGSTHLQKDAPNSINLTIDQPMVDGWQRSVPNHFWWHWEWLMIGFTTLTCTELPLFVNCFALLIGEKNYPH